MKKISLFFRKVLIKIIEFYQKHKRHKNGIGTANGPSWNRNKKVKKDARFSVRRG